MNNKIILGLLVVAFAASASAMDISAVRDRHDSMVSQIRSTLDEHRATVQACRSQACVAGCFDRINQFAGDECLAPDLDYIFNTTSFTFNPLFDFGTLFPFSNDTASNEDYAEFCGCGAAYARFFRTFLGVARCVGEQAVAEPDGDDDGSDDMGLPFDESNFGDFFEFFVDFACIQNGDDYCQILFRQPDANISSFDGASNATKCAAIDAVGCCAKSVADLRNSEFLMTAFGNETATEFDALDAALTDCGYGSLQPCLGPGDSATFTKSQVTLQANYTALAQNATVERVFRRAFAKDMAAALNLDPPQIEILNITQGSIVVDFRIRGNHASAIMSAASDGIPMTNVNSEVGSQIAEDGSGSVGAVDSTAVGQTQTETVTNDAVTNPAAAAASPAAAAPLLLVVAAASALLL